MRQQFVDAAVQVHWQPGEHVLEVSPRVVPAELGRLHQAHHHGRTLPGQFTAGEQPGFSAHRPLFFYQKMEVKPLISLTVLTNRVVDGSA